MSDAQQFVHLHVHTEYSILDGAARIKDMVTEAVRLGMPAVAITDHGNLHGLADFYKATTKAGLTPVLGIEAYLAPSDRFHKKTVRWGRDDQRGDDVSGSGRFTHATLWAQNHTGLRNLFRLSSLASIEGQYGKPRMDRDLLSKYADGIMATTGCPSGEVQTRLRLGQPEAALEAAGAFRDIFGPDNYFVEIMDHGLEIERRVRDGLIDIARKLNLPPVVTNDSHYTLPEQAEAHDALLCVQTGANISDTNRFRFDGKGYYLRSAEEMYAIDGSDIWQQGCANTLLIAERVDTAGMFSSTNLMPTFPVPDGHTEQTWFDVEVWAGMARRYPDGIPDDRRAQCEYEMGVISQMGFCGYFLIVSDFVMWAKINGGANRVGPGRGSAAGSMVAYAMGITELDPITHGLIFERFLNPERVQMPDIDMDFDERLRMDAIRYVTQKYGADRVAMIGTFGTIKAKAAIKDAARVLGYPYAVGDRITKAMPPAVMGKDIPLSGIFDPQHPRYAEATEIRTLHDTDADVARVIGVARGLEGLVRQTGVHAAGIIMSAEPLIDHVPLMRREADDATITQWDYPTCESIGLIKMDFLGLRNLSILDDALRYVEMTSGRKIDLNSLSLEDIPTYELLARGDTLGVFQLDGGPMRDLLRLMKPDSFDDISAALALYRPGPMGANSHTNYALRKTGLQPVTPIHPELEKPLEKILGPTYGLIVYQEQVQMAAVELAGYNLGQADNLRKAMGKKIKAVLDKEFKPFQDGMRERGYSDEAIQTLWDILVPFADYAFNKAHTASYGLVSFWTAYLKANYPAEYMAALLTSVGDDKDKMAVYLAECKRMGIQVLLPDVNASIAPFAPVGGDIRFGLTAVRNVGANVVESIIEARKEKGAFTSFADFMTKVGLVVCNKRTIESLIKAGAFDSLGHTRRGLLDIHETAVEAVTGIKKQEAAGQFDLFGTVQAEDTVIGLDLTIREHEWNRKDLLALEREMLGLYVSSHPLAGTEKILRANSDRPIIQIFDEGLQDGAMVSVAGMLVGVSRRTTKQGKMWASATLEDLGGSIEVLFFPNSYEVVGPYLIEDAIVAVKGRVSQRDTGATSIIGMDLAALHVTEADLDAHPAVILSMPIDRVYDLTDPLARIVNSHPGKHPVHLRLRGRPKDVVLDLKVTVDPGVGFRSEVKGILGATAFA
ncbi:DNA polymerase-3 subunit alpha [Allocatelliglobosispora scoriae]|uniref:DNA polymerase III subunit alpha n=1 Tax=Allocatelliglobosispora scoriae TaxID=643052 RepID=A0A841C3Z2_9ACTN|nr:DNA polymerase III subunit alpha [Allocatelliglobosispora scoriae]MBB5874656.1 DNA polymerase-3 subunit alpha [Allocatelliglobosispora scoriae]